MKQSTTVIFAFLSGAVIGAVATNFLVRKKYQLKAQKDIDAARETFRANNKSANNLLVVQEDIKLSETEEEMSEVSKFAKSVLSSEEYQAVIDKVAYHKISEKAKVQVTENDGDTINPVNIFEILPYIITPEEFANGPDEVPEDIVWEADTLIYYKDGVLADQDGTPIEDIEGMVGNDALDSFGQYEDDSVFVRNERIHTDFEILLDDELWEEKMKKEKPELIERKPHEVIDDE